MGQSTDEMTRGIQQTRESLSRDVDELTDKISPSRIVSRRKEAASSRLRGLRDQVMGSAQDGTDQLTSAAQGVGESATDVVHGVQAKAQGNPLGAGLVAFGAGLVLSSLIPASKAEATAVQHATDVAKEQGGPVLDEAKAAGQQAADQLKDSASQAADSVRSTAQDAAAHVQDEARSSADNVKDAAPGT
jgi:ElaB/YqjD/DUF883 family membrane-anchored ribosome-binding protein